MSQTQCLMILIISLSIFCVSSSFDKFRFDRQLACNKQDAKGYCKDWNQTTVLYRYSLSIYYCFPGESYVRTSKGPVQLKELKLEDQMFGLNLETGKNEFSPVTAWLHRDASSLMEYSLIQVQNSSWKFISSKYHNIAFSNDHQTDFKFLKDLNPNDTLISITSTGQDFRVESIDLTEEKQGLYSPMTNTGTFYIYPESFSIEEYEKDAQQYPMILVHCLSQVRNPTKNQGIVQKYVAVSHGIFGTHQPGQDDEYVSALLSTFNGLFGNDWVSVEGEQIAHKYSSTNSYANSRQRQEQQRKRKTAAVLAVQNMFSDSLL